MTEECTHGLSAARCPDCWPPGKRIEIPGGFIRFDVPVTREQAERARQRYLDARGEPPKWIPPYEPAEPDRIADPFRIPGPRVRRAIGYGALVIAALALVALLAGSDGPAPQPLPAQDPTV